MAVTDEHDVTGKRSDHKSFGQTLTSKFHGIPVWGLILGGGIVFGIAARYYKSTHSNATPTTADSTSADTPSDGSDLTSADSGLPWSGGAPDGNAQYQSDLDDTQSQQEASDAAAATAAENALAAAQAASNNASQSAILSLTSQLASQASAFASQFSAFSAANVPAPIATPTPAASGVPQSVATIPQAGPGGKPSYLPTKTVAADSKLGKVHAA